jgi:hypothetical protein
MDLSTRIQEVLPERNKVLSTSDRIAYANVLALLAIGEHLSRTGATDS